ncbi:MAG: glycosyltransferase [Butyrivibrio sp.]|uniref:glycosyltransferase family 2 protein n=1 Tax=Butyrivibrio sp. TaxID=28121 RepID=UPI0025E32933|nr:glycosyltransferase [Butyrivibrio sp.]MCR5769651.1 glycosyltransferase [Butyrivibrio sp.]
MVNNNVKLSVIIPVYNADKYISDCLNSIIKNASSDIEILVIDDGSTDNSKNIISDFIKRDGRIKCITQENSGVSEARNNGLRNAKGEYILFLDADDYLEEDVFNYLILSLYEDVSDYTAYSKKILYSDGTTKDIFYSCDQEKCSDSGYINELMYASSSFNECWGKVFKKEIIDKYNIKFPKNIAIGEDLLFVYDYFEKCKSLELVNKCLIVYRQHSGSAMKKSLTDDRLKYTDMLYTVGNRYVNALNDKRLSYKADIYYFRVITNLCREYAACKDNNKCIEMIYRSEVAQKVMSKLNISMIPLYKKHEYLLIKLKLVKLSALYYRLKARA